MGVAPVVYGQSSRPEAVEAYRAALALQPSQPEWHYRHGWMLERLQRPADAAAAYARAFGGLSAEDREELADEAVARATAAKKQKDKTSAPRPVPLTDVDGEPVRYPVRAFIHTWGELTQWWTHYDPAVLAVELTDEHVATFLRVIEHTIAFADALQAALTSPDDTTTAACGTVDEQDDGPAGGRPQLRAI